MKKIRTIEDYLDLLTEEDVKVHMKNGDILEGEIHVFVSENKIFIDLVKSSRAHYVIPFDRIEYIES